MSNDARHDNSPEKVVQIRRCACVVKGGRRFSFTALVVVGDQKGRVGYGYAKGVEVPNAVEKAVKSSNRRMIKVNLKGRTIPHQVEGRFGSSRVILIPAAPGTGVIAGNSVRAVLESAGIHDILTKCIGTNNPQNVIHATVAALQKLRSPDSVARRRGLALAEMQE